MWPLDAVLHEKYLLPADQAELIASFLTPMMRLQPDKRAKASELVHHTWLDGIVVQGEIDLIRRAEEQELLLREAERKRASGKTGGSMGSESLAILALAEERHHMEEMIDADALKPVGEVLQVDDQEPQKPPIVTPTMAQKENQTQHHHVQVQQLQSQTMPHPPTGHRHTGSKGTIARIDTSGVAKQPPGKL